MIKQIIFLKRNRLRKKSKIYQQVLLLSFDVTSLFYILLVIGYFFTAILLEGNIRNNLHDKMITIEAYTVEQFWVILTAIPIVYIIRAFRQPGVLFSTAEYMLTCLPHTVQQVWRITVLERWIKSGTTYLIGGGIIYLLSPTSSTIVLFYILILFGLNVLMTVPEWKLFQQHVLLKIGVLIGIFLINLLHVFVKSSLLGIVFIFLLFLINLFLYPKIFKQINWKKVTASSDFKVWNMVAISYVTKIKFKKQRQYSVWQRLSFWKKPFPYQKVAGYNRLWHLYFEKNISICLKLIGALLIFMTLFVFVKNELFILTVAISVHSFTTVSTSLFNDRLRTDLVQILPWDLELFKRTFLKWAYGASVVLLLPLLIYTCRDFSVWTIIQVVGLIFSFIFLLTIKVEKGFKKLDSNAPSFVWTETLCYFLMLFIIFSNLYTQLVVVGCLLIGIIPFLKKSAK